MSGSNDTASDFLAQESGSLASPGAMLRSDPLSDVLRAVRLTAATFFVIDATHPYCVDIPHTDHYRAILQRTARHMMSFHVVLEGQGTAMVPGGDLQQYRAGDILVFPRGDGYRMGTAAETPPQFDYVETIAFFRHLAAGKLPFIIPEGGGAAPLTRIICGFLGCDAGPFNPLIQSLSPLFVVRRHGANTLLDRLIDLTMVEARQVRAGGASVRLGLAELMFVETIRLHIADSDEVDGWFAGLRDPVVGRALACLHADPARYWTLNTLAADAATSRSTLAERFNRCLGLGPMQYLTNWRIQLAACRLVESHDSIARIAVETGYGSEAAFSRAFKRIAGMSPAAWRRDQHTSGPAGEDDLSTVHPGTPTA